MIIKRIKEINQKKQDWSNRIRVLQNFQQINALFLQELGQVSLLGPEWSADEKDILKGELFLIYTSYSGYDYDSLSYSEKAKLISIIEDSVIKYNINLAICLKPLAGIAHLSILSDLLNTKSVQSFLDNYPKKDAILLSFFDNWYVNHALEAGYTNKVFAIFKGILRVDPINYRSENGQTVLHLVYRAYYKHMIINLYNQYHDLVNVLDKSGNSPLYYAINLQDNYYIYGDMCDPVSYELYAQLMAAGAKYIRNHIETKNVLHLRVAMHQPLQLDTLKLQNVDIDAIDLETGRTALTHAVVLKNDEATIELIQHGASCIKPDHYNKTPLEYALGYGDKNLVLVMIKHLPADFLTSKHQRSLIAMACFSGNKDLYTWLKANLKIKNKIDEAIIAMVDQVSYMLPTSAENLNYMQQLTVYAAVAKIVPHLTYLVSLQARQNVLSKYIANPAALPTGAAYGVELELSDVPCVPDMPLDLMLSWFDVSFKHDGSVDSSIFSAHNLCVFQEEIVSRALDSTAKIKQFLLFSEHMYNAGATVGKSTGMHVHINIQGSRMINLPSITSSMRLGNMNVADVELAVIKQLITNWVKIEPLLQDFLRRGELQNIDWFDHHYAAPIKHLLDTYMECKTIDEIIAASPVRYHALNVESLRNSNNAGGIFDYGHGHGTIEIRIHEGAIHRSIVGAWLNFIHRLTRISVDQVQDKISNNEPFEFTPSDKVEDLVHILLAERNYALTWDDKLKSAVDSTAPVTISDWPVHEEIQRADVYSCYQNSKAKHMALDCAGEVPIGLKPHAVGNVTNWLKLTDQYPGVYAENFTPINDRVKNHNANSGLDDLFMSTRDVEFYQPAILFMFMVACMFIGMKNKPMLFNYDSKRSNSERSVLPLVDSVPKNSSYGTIDNGRNRTNSLSMV